MLVLSDKVSFARGGRRVCYVHPEDPSRCIKVLRDDGDRFTKTGRTIVPAIFRSEYDNNEDERRSLDRLARRLGDDYRHLPRCFGYAETDIGRGLVLDLLRDADGRISLSLRQAMQEGIGMEAIRSAYKEMANYFVSRGVVTRGILDHNLIAQQTPDGVRLVLIDGFGDSTLVPLRSMFASMRRSVARKRTTQGWERIEGVAARIARGDVDWDRSRWSQGLLDHRGVAETDGGSA